MKELSRAICANLTKVMSPTGTVAVEEIESRSWASVTFTGARHQLRVRLGGAGAAAAADSFLADLTEAEFVLHGHILADIALVSDARPDDGAQVLLTLEALTVEDC